MVLGLTQPLTEMSTRNIFWGVKAAGAYSCQPYHLQVPTVLKSGSLNLLEPSGPVQACNGIALPLLTPSGRVVRYKLTVPLSRNSPHFMKPKCLLLCSLVPVMSQINVEPSQSLYFTSVLLVPNMCLGMPSINCTEPKYAVTKPK